jgi:hypothetical protein
LLPKSLSWLAIFLPSWEMSTRSMDSSTQSFERTYETGTE